MAATQQALAAADAGPPAPWLAPLARRAEAVLIPLGALIAGLLAFGLFLLALDRSPVEFYQLVYKAGFGTAFSWQNTLSRVDHGKCGHHDEPFTQAPQLLRRNQHACEPRVDWQR